MWQFSDRIFTRHKIIFIQGNKIKIGIFTKFKLINLLTIFSYVSNIISINKLQNLKVVKCFVNSINYDNSLKNILYLELKEVRL